MTKKEEATVRAEPAYLVEPDLYGGWIYREHMKHSYGFKVFNRVGRQTIFQLFGRKPDREKFFTAEKKFCIVRNPWHRLASVYFGMVRNPSVNTERYGFPPVRNFDEFLDYVLSTPDKDRNPYIMSMTRQLQGWVPEDHEVWTLINILLENPMNLRVERTPWVNKSKIPDDWEDACRINPDLVLEWGKQYSDDINLFKKATANAV